MGKKYKNSSEGNDSVLRFEEMLRNGDNLFFDLNTYEYIISHFIEQGKFKKALKACDYAINQYPFSVELLLDKIQLLIRKENFEEALEMLEKAESFQPFDPEIILMRGNILSSQEKFEEAIEHLTKAIDFLEDKD